MSSKCFLNLKSKNVCDESSYRCKICKKSFKNFMIFEGHFAFNLKCRAKNGWFIQCYICRQKFQYFAELKYHLHRHALTKSLAEQANSKIVNGTRIDDENGQFISDYQCNVCQRNFRTKVHLNEHMISHSKKPITKKTRMNGGNGSVDLRESLMNLRCQVCKSHFSDETALENHKTTHAPARLKCNGCSLSFTAQVSLLFHQKLFHQCNTAGKLNEKNLQCDICKAKFSFIGNLNRHKLVHTTGDVECEICHIRFTKKSLDVHEKQAHPELVKGDVAEGDNDRHPVSTEENVSPVNEKKTLPRSTKNNGFSEDVPQDRNEDSTHPTCDQCNRSFSNISHLRQHLKSHRQYSCNICDRKFKTSSGMQSHIRSHKFECYICNTDFPSINDVSAHIHRHLVYEKWVDPMNVYLSNWDPEQAREILQNQPLVLVENLNVRNMDLNCPIQWNKKAKEPDPVEPVPEIIEKIKIDDGTDVSSMINGHQQTDIHGSDELDNLIKLDQIHIELKYSEQTDLQTIYDKKEMEHRIAANGVVDEAESSDNEDVLIVAEQTPDTTTASDDVIDVSSESEVDDVTELYHCYFCNDTFRSLRALGVHVDTCSFCP